LSGAESIVCGISVDRNIMPASTRIRPRESRRVVMYFFIFNITGYSLSLSETNRRMQAIEKGRANIPAFY
jgi:hypothetical protein